MSTKDGFLATINIVEPTGSLAFVQLIYLPCTRKKRMHSFNCGKLLLCENEVSDVLLDMLEQTTVYKIKMFKQIRHN